MASSWEDLPDIEEAPAAKQERAPWEDLPDVKEPPKPSNLVKLMAFLGGQANPYAPAGAKRVTFDPDEAQAAREQSQQFADTQRAYDKEKMLKGVLSFVSGGGPLTDELAGAQEAVKSGVRTLSESGYAVDPLTAYRRGRDSARTEVDQATRDASPTANLPLLGETPVLPMLGAIVSTLPIPGAATWVKRLAAGGFIGGLGALSGSRADLTRGDPKQVRRALVDTALGTGTGIVAAGVAEAPRALGKFGEGLQRRGAIGQMFKSADAAAKQTATARAASGQAGTAFRREVELALDMLRNPDDFAPEVVDAARKSLSRPEVQEELARQMANVADELPAAAARKAATRDEFVRVAAEESQRAADDAAQRLASPYTNVLGPRAVRGAYRTATAAGDSAIGSVTKGLLPSSPVSVTMMMNMAKDPAMKFALGGSIQKWATPLGNSGTAAATGAARAAQSASDISDEDKKAISAFIDGG